MKVDDTVFLTRLFVMIQYTIVYKSQRVLFIKQGITCTQLITKLTYNKGCDRFKFQMFKIKLQTNCSIYLRIFFALQRKKVINYYY